MAPRHQFLLLLKLSTLAHLSLALAPPAAVAHAAEESRARTPALEARGRYRRLGCSTARLGSSTQLDSSNPPAEDSEESEHATSQLDPRPGRPPRRSRTLRRKRLQVLTMCIW